MSERRTIIRQLARERRMKRRDIVHAAGCVDDTCIVKRAVFNGYELVNEACAAGIRIPRSVARQHGLEER